jgi:hypothetical protein
MEIPPDMTPRDQPRGPQNAQAIVPRPWQMEDELPLKMAENLRSM